MPLAPPPKIQFPGATTKPARATQKNKPVTKPLTWGAHGTATVSRASTTLSGRGSADQSERFPLKNFVRECIKRATDQARAASPSPAAVPTTSSSRSSRAAPRVVPCFVQRLWSAFWRCIRQSVMACIIESTNSPSESLLVE